MSDSKHICVDIETLSTNPTAAIVSISAVKFSLKTDDVETFTINIDPLSCKSYDLHFDPETINWWKDKPKEAKTWMTNGVPLEEALNKFVLFTGTDKYQRWYCNGLNFDFPILQYAMYKTGIKPPWSYWLLTDMRTAYFLGDLDTHKAPRIGTYHDGVSDCLTQISWYKHVLGIKPINL